MQIPLTSVQDAGVAIRTMRKRAGIRIDDFALIAGVSKQFMTDLENGKVTVQMGMVLGLLQRMAVGVTIDLPDDAVKLYQVEFDKVTRRRSRKIPLTLLALWLPRNSDRIEVGSVFFGNALGTPNNTT